MAYYEKDEIYDAYTKACDEAIKWRIDYPEYERLMENGLLEGLDPNLPEVNDGSLAASLFKLAKRVVKTKLGGRPIALDRDDKWINELADMQWRNNIQKNAKSMATPRRKWKDAVRKMAGYGGQPIISLFVENGNYTGADFIVPYCQDVKLEAGKVSDLDSDIIFWDVYYSKVQLRSMIEEAKEEMKSPNNDGYNKWDIKLLEEIYEGTQVESRPGNEEHTTRIEEGVQTDGYKFYIAFQRGVEAPFYMCHGKQVVREWSNPDPTGDVPVHYLYCYQDFVNPYGVGIVKLAGGTQNVLDYMRQADILATQVGISPPKVISGNVDGLDEESMVLAPDANWYAGNAQVTPWNMANGVYQQIPERVGMYKVSLNQVLPTGDTSISGESSGDPNTSKTPAGIKFQAASLSIDDEDFAENVDECYAAVAKSMINIHFANMQGKDLMKLTGDEAKILQRAGLEFPIDEDGELSHQIEIEWDKARATFDFEVDPDADKTADEEAALDGKLRAYELINSDPNIDMLLQMSGKKLNRGELLADIFSQLTDNDKIVEDMGDEELAQAQGIDPTTGMPIDPAMGEAVEGEVVEEDPEFATFEQEEVNVNAIMEQYEVPENIAMAMREAEMQGYGPEEIMQLKDQLLADEQGVVNG